VCNALFDALFHILPLSTDMDRIEPTHAKSAKQLVWLKEAQELLHQFVSQQPVLVQISAAKKLRDHAEVLSRRAGLDQVESDQVRDAGRELGLGASA
jgi:3,8-divinyl chlorophyllide a/chlorophyllide a reductase subunit Z